jgi:glycosyltransferase involved in cell wall biosynthesis
VQRLTGSVSEALDSFGSVDVVHDNGIWLLHNHRLAAAAADRGIPRVVSTRGMLEPWAMNHKRLKKRLAWSLYQRRDLTRARCHHATAETEASNVRGLGLSVPVHVIPNGVDLPEVDQKTESLSGRTVKGKKKTALFLARIHPKKGLPMLVEAWARVRPNGWNLQIAGPDESGHQAQVQRVVCAAGLDDVISFLGPLDEEAKRSAFLEANLFVLPTHSESFGMVIAEALAHGLPVLTTTGAPWPMLPERDCGWWVDPTVAGIAAGLHQATSVDPQALHVMGIKGREFVASEFGWLHIANQFVSIYEGLIVSNQQSSSRFSHK